jgi:hypothetical protein
MCGINVQNLYHNAQGLTRYTVTAIRFRVTDMDRHSKVVHYGQTYSLRPGLSFDISDGNSKVSKRYEGKALRFHLNYINSDSICHLT